MNTVEKSRSPVYRQLEAYEETWKHDHNEAMACRDWEDTIAVGMNIFSMVADREEAWRDQVFRGVIPFSEEDNLDHRNRFANWLETTKAILAEVLPVLEQQFQVVERASRLRQCAELVEKRLREWQPPRLSQAVGLREMTLSPESAAEFDRLLKEAQRHPPQIPAGPVPQEISGEEFFRRVRQSRP